jgi:ribosomal 30S subunit maturation factor RimM
MTRLKTTAILLGATALTVPLALSPAAAQQQGQQQESGREGACEQLYQLVQQSEQAGEDLLEEFQQAPQVAEANEAEACVLMIEKVETAGGMTTAAQERGQGSDVTTETETFTARDRVSQTVEIEQEAVVEGQVMVRQPIPEIGIEQGGPQVEVAEAPVDVDIQEQPAEITIRQAPANVRVEIPQPKIMIEQPAPEIVITMPPPGVSLDRQQPKVSVNMPDPTVTVSQAEPDVTADVQARFVSGEELAQLEQQGQQPQVTTQTERSDAAGNPVDSAREAEVTVRKGEPEVMIQPPQDQGQVRVQPADPRVVYQPAEPNVEVAYAENADVQVQQVGEPTVRIERQGEQQAAAQGQQQQAAQGQQQQDQQQAAEQGQQTQQQSQREANQMTPEDTTRLLGMQEGAQSVEAELVQVTAADLEGRDVVTLNGEEVGEIDGIFQNGGSLYAVIAHGGFLGIGEDQIAIPAERIAVQGDKVVLLGLTEEQLQQMPEYDFGTDQEMAGSDVVEIGRYE